MKTLVLLAGLASATVQPVADVPEATGAEIRAKFVLAEADVAPEAAVAAAFLPAARAVETTPPRADASPWGEGVPPAQESPDAGVRPRGLVLDAALGTEAAVAYTAAFGLANPCAAEAELACFALADAPGARATEAGNVAVFPESAASAICRLAGLVHHRFLSGPWSAARRLEAARLRGDADEVRRMEELLGELVVEAVIVREGGDR